MKKLLLGLCLASLAFGQAYRGNSGFATSALRNGDDNFAEVQLPFPINFSGRTYNSVFISNNGNITFGTVSTVLDGRANFVPRGLRQINFPMIAPFYADIDTTRTAAVTYGTDRVNNRPAFGINWPGVGRFDRKVDKLNTFQLVLIERSDTGAGNFDIEFNYDSIQWDIGDDTILGRAYASAGYTNGLGGDNAQSFEVPGSLTEGGFLDGGPFALVGQSRNSGVSGRLFFEVRSGGVNDTTLVIQPDRTTRECPEVTLYARGSGYRVAPFVTPNFVRSVVENGQSREITSFVFLPVAGAAPGTYDFIVRYRSVVPLDPAGALFPLNQVQLNISIPAFANTPTFAASDTKTIRNCAVQAQCGTLPTTALVGFQLTGRAAATGGIPPYTFNATNLPSGLALNAAGSLSGAATAPGTFSYSVTARDSSTPVQSASATCRIVVTGQANPVAATCETPAATAGASYTGAIRATGGSGSYVFTLTSGELPPGLTLNRSTGVITGTLGANASGAYPFAVTVSDANASSSSSPAAGQSALVNCSITVSSVVVTPPSITSLSPVAAVVGGSPFTLTISGTNFNSASRLIWNTFELATTLVNPTTLAVTVPANLLGAPGEASLLVRNAPNVQSAATAFEVLPALSNLSFEPTALRATGQDTQVTLRGAGFWPGIGISVNNAVASSRRISASEVQFTVPAANLRAPGVLNIRAANPNNIALTANLTVNPAVSVTPTFTLDRPGVITDQNAVTLRLSAPAGVPTTANFRITFVPNADNQPANTDTDFPRFTGVNSRLLTVNLAADSTEARNVIDQGTVAGVATVTLESFTAGGVDLLSGQRPTQTFNIDPSAPLILPGTVAVTRTANGISVEAIAISSVRNLTAGTVTFILASGVQANGSLTFPIENLPALGTTWFGSAAGRTAGGAFRITIPYTFEGDFNNLQSVSVTLSNARGASPAVTGNRR